MGRCSPLVIGIGANLRSIASDSCINNHGTHFKSTPQTCKSFLSNISRCKVIVTRKHCISRHFLASLSSTIVQFTPQLFAFLALQTIIYCHFDKSRRKLNKRKPSFYQNPCFSSFFRSFLIIPYFLPY